jgi:hypothetical protein
MGLKYYFLPRIFTDSIQIFTWSIIILQGSIWNIIDFLRNTTRNLSRQQDFDCERKF